MRVLVLTQMYPPHHLGGYELACRDVVERWLARGHEVEVLTTTYRLADASGEGSAPVRRELGFYWVDGKILNPPLLKKIAIERSNQRALQRALDEFRPDVVSVWHMGAMSFGLLQAIVDRNMPMVLVLADDWLVYGPAVDAWTKTFTGRPRLGRLVRQLTGLPTAWEPQELTACFASDWLRRRARENSDWPLTHTTVTFLGIDADDFPTAPQDPTPWTWRMLCVGRVEERKGVHVAIEALSHLPEETTLKIVGPSDEPYLQRLRIDAARSGVGDRVHFAGTVDRAELRRSYLETDVFVFPVLWEEPFGLVPLEAMACGTPVVATGTGGSAEFLLDEVNCLIVPRGNAGAVAEAVHRLAADPALVQKLRAGGLATVRQLGADQLAETLERWHVAASSRFADGVPADRPTIRAAVGPSASGPDPTA